MQVYANNYNNAQNFNANLKIYDCGGQYNRLKESVARSLENKFAEKTQKIDGQLDILLFNHLNGQVVRPDKIEYKNGTYKDVAELNVSISDDDNKTVDKLVDIFCGFKNIEGIKRKISTILQ